MLASARPLPAELFVVAGIGLFMTVAVGVLIWVLYRASREK